MAVSGLALFGFVIGHLLGNLQIFLGPDAVNAYAAFLKSRSGLLWTARAGLLAMAAVHIAAAASLTVENLRARPVAYARRRYIAASYASRTMHVSGLIVLAYLVYHLMHFAFRSVHPEFSFLVDGQGRHDVYTMIVRSFQEPAIGAAYIAGNALLGMHLSHGLYSLFQSLGLVAGGARARWRGIAHAAGYGVAFGYISIPVAVLTGIVKP